MKIEGAVTTLDKLTEQLDQRREIQEQHQLYQKLMKISKGGDNALDRERSNDPGGRNVNQLFIIIKYMYEKI